MHELRISNFLANFFFRNFGINRKPLMVKDYKRDWAQAAAREKLKAMRGEGHSLMEIARLLGFSGVFIGNVLRKENPDPVSEKLWDAMIERLDFHPAQPSYAEPQSKVAEVSDPKASTASPELLARIQSLEQAVSAMQSALIGLQDAVIRLAKS